MTNSEKPAIGLIEKVTLRSIEPIPRLLPFDLEFKEIFPDNLKSLHQFYKLMDDNYIEDEESSLRFNYVHEFLGSILRTPGWNKFTSLGVSFKGSMSIIGSITSIPKFVMLKNICLNSCEINFLCLRKNYRKKNFTQYLIMEITRRLNLIGVLQAFYTTGLSFNKFLSSSRYYHIPLNLERLKNFGFCSNDTIFPNYKPKLISFDRFSNESLNKTSCFLKLRYQQTKLDLYQLFDRTNFEHIFKNIDGVLYNFFFAAEGPTNFISFFSLPSKLIGVKPLNFIYPIQYFYSTLSRQDEFTTKMALNLLILLGFDIINIIQGSSTDDVFYKIAITKGTGVLQYHLFNFFYECVENMRNSLVFY